ncbi:MAG: hypothetical protein M0016_00010 [Deltaproteobacteria bacterium]|jgi:hypothetical protein|nr:hypothetical protein [Deltaproteobacteria bacterium]
MRDRHDYYQQNKEHIKEMQRRRYKKKGYADREYTKQFSKEERREWLQYINNKIINKIIKERGKYDGE